MGEVSESRARAMEMIDETVEEDSRTPKIQSFLCFLGVFTTHNFSISKNAKLAFSKMQN